MSDVVTRCLAAEVVLDGLATISSWTVNTSLCDPMTVYLYAKGALDVKRTILCSLALVRTVDSPGARMSMVV